MRVWAIGYGVTAAAFLGCDAVWLGVMAKRLYRPLLGPLMREDFALAPAVAFYALYVAGIVFFAEAPARGAPWTAPLLRGALLGLLAYGTYDLTNQATLRGWPLALTFTDLAWGALVTAVAATAGWAAMRAVAG